MKASELVTKLEDLMRTHGDCDVTRMADDENAEDIENVVFMDDMIIVD